MQVIIYLALLLRFKLSSNKKMSSYAAFKLTEAFHGAVMASRDFFETAKNCDDIAAEIKGVKK